MICASLRRDEIDDVNDCMTDRGGRQVGRQTGKQAGRQTDGQIGRQTDGQIGRQTDGQTGRQADRQADRQAYRRADRRYLPNTMIRNSFVEQWRVSHLSHNASSVRSIKTPGVRAHHTNQKRFHHVGTSRNVCLCPFPRVSSM